MEREAHPPAPAKNSDLAPRVISGLVMAAGALFTAWWGGWPFKIVWFLLAGIVLREWISILFPGERIDNFARAIPYLLLMASFFGPVSILLLTDHRVSAGMIAGALAVGVLASTAFTLLKGWPKAKWAIAGCLYATVLFAGVVLLRLADEYGLAAIFFLFVVVWGADTGAYFAGRTIGGPKLAPRISPSKTWSGFCGGILSGILLGCLLLALLGVPLRPMHAAIAGALALASVAGDLFESFFKRRFGVKDSGHLIPGHGGFMDRLDGFIFAVALAMLIGILRGGADGAGAGLLAGW
jgi:phosphatidate cytidylyltransferase